MVSKDFGEKNMQGYTRETLASVFQRTIAVLLLCGSAVPVLAENITSRKTGSQRALRHPLACDCP